MPANGRGSDSMKLPYLNVSGCDFWSRESFGAATSGAATSRAAIFRSRDRQERPADSFDRRRGTVQAGHNFSRNRPVPFTFQVVQSFKS